MLGEMDNGDGETMKAKARIVRFFIRNSDLQSWLSKVTLMELTGCGKPGKMAMQLFRL
jgi:hypothetical protein